MKSVSNTCINLRTSLVNRLASFASIKHFDYFNTLLREHRKDVVVKEEKTKFIFALQTKFREKIK